MAPFGLKEDLKKEQYAMNNTLLPPPQFQGFQPVTSPPPSPGFVQIPPPTGQFIQQSPQSPNAQLGASPANQSSFRQPVINGASTIPLY